MAVANDLYAFLLGHQLRNDAQDWLCCKILYTASIDIKIYSETGREPQLDKEMYKDLLTRPAATTDKYAKRAGQMFAWRIIGSLKKLCD